MTRQHHAMPEASPARRIVVAEDEGIIRLDLVEMLAQDGFEVVGQAADGQTALEVVRETRPDVVLLDVKMPVRDGLWAAERIVEEGLAAVVMLTAFSDREFVTRAGEIGVFGYVVKPVTIDDVRPALDVAHARRRAFEALTAEVGDLEERLETRKAVDRAKGVLMARLGLGEADAFRWIQKTAMDRRVGMKAVAEAVLTDDPPTSDDEGPAAP